MNAANLLESVLNLKAELKKALEDIRATSDRNHSNEMRTIGLLKAIAGELVHADPLAKARMHASLDKLILLHGDDEAVCLGIKEASRVIALA